jgi:pyrophosphatase PpaX
MPRDTRPPFPHALLFDLDGTVLDTVELLLRSMRHAFAGRARSPSDADWIAGLGTPLHGQFMEFAESPADLDTLVASYRAYQMAHHDALTRAFPGTREALVALRDRGHRLGVVTSKLDEFAHRGLAHVGLDDLFETVIGVGATTRHKPHPEPVLAALDRMHIAPDDAAFVGDSPHDIAAGNAAGVLTIAALWGPFSREALDAAAPTCLLDRIQDLPALVARMRKNQHHDVQTFTPRDSSHPVR